jgi:hypothetical protein
VFLGELGCVLNIIDVSSIQRGGSGGKCKVPVVLHARWDRKAEFFLSLCLCLSHCRLFIYTLSLLPLLLLGLAFLANMRIVLHSALAIVALGYYASGIPTLEADLKWYNSEIAYLASLKDRVTGSANHNKLIDHIQNQLQGFGYQVCSDTLSFSYNDSPLSPPKLTIDGESVNVSSYIPYSGNTDAGGVSGKLVNLISPGPVPNWAAASDGIAVVNVTNAPLNLSRTFAQWSGSPPWPIETGQPDGNAEVEITNLTLAAAAGVKAIVYVWEEMSTGNALGQYVPFHFLWEGVPAVFVAGSAVNAVLEGAANNSTATVVLNGALIPDTTTRSIWVVVEGSTYANESIILSTHTDGVNALEENGHIALLAKARHLIANPPERTTILLFVTGHMHIPAFTATGRATTRWLADNPAYWIGGPGQMKAVAASCVEHLGAVHFDEDLTANTYRPTSEQEPEWLFAATEELNAMLLSEWVGSIPGLTRVNNPNPTGTQSGEGVSNSVS